MICLENDVRKVLVNKEVVVGAFFGINGKLQYKTGL